MNTAENRSGFFIVLGFYIAWMLAVAWISSKKKITAAATQTKEQEYDTHFLGGKGYGSFVLFMTLFSTIYSGYTVVGVPNEAANLGFIATRWLSSAPMLQLASIIFIPRFRRLSVARKWSSPNDLASDRFDNRLITVITSLTLVGPQLLYVIAQFFTLKNLIPVLSLGQMDPEISVWFFGAVIYICETIGGFDAVSLTDSIQSCLMIGSLILVPIVATYYYGGAAASMKNDCDNAVTIICNATTAAMAGCARPGTQGFVNGCLGAPAGGAPWLTLHPATGWSEYFKPLYPTGTVGVDGSLYFSNSGVGMLSFNLLFMAFFLNPHWLQRTMAASSDQSVRKSNIAFTLAALVATLPAVLVGVMIKANLVNLFPPGSEPFGVVLSDFMSKGGFAGFVAVIASCSAIAAIMSTADSTIIGVTNVLSMDFLKNGLFQACPSLDTARNMTIFSKVTSLVITVIGISVALYDEELSKDDSVYGKLISIQNMILWQALPTFLLGMFMRKAKGWAILVGYLAGYASMVIFYWYQNDAVTLYGTPLASMTNGGGIPSVKTFYLDTAVWAGLINLFVAFVLSLLPVEVSCGCLKMNIGKYADRLTFDKIQEIMKDTTEPIFTKVGVVCAISTALLVNLSLPFYGDSYDGCDFMTYVGWVTTGQAVGTCAGPDLLNGIPRWAVAGMACFVVALFSNMTAWYQWKTVDTESMAEMMGMDNLTAASPNTPTDPANPIPGPDPEQQLLKEDPGIGN